MLRVLPSSPRCTVCNLPFSGIGGIAVFTALGDNLNPTARLASLASAGEILVSGAELDSGGLPGGDLESRDVVLKGRDAPVTVSVLHA
jgi:adenylate cyclase